MSYYYRGSRPLVSRDRATRGSAGRGSSARGSGRREAEDLRPEFDPAYVLEVKRAQNYSGNAPVMTKPKVLGSYSVDSERDFGHDQSMLHFLDQQYLPEKGKMKVNLDLNKGSEKFTRYTGNTEEIFQNLLRWIVNNQNCLTSDASPEKLSADCISVRGTFTKVMRTPYNFYEPWTFYATEYKGSVYLINWKREEEVAFREEPVMDAVSKWGHTFECYMTGGDPEKGVDANEEYRCALRTSVLGSSLLYAPEVDCVDPEQYEEDFENLEAFVLVKCCKELTDERKVRNHKRFKLNQLWVENKLSGIPRTLIGYRNDDGIVHTLELVNTDDLPEISEGEWDPNVCINFLVKFLEFVKERLKNDPGVAFTFEHESKGHIYCRKLSGPDHINLLPCWYTNGLFANDNSDEESD